MSPEETLMRDLAAPFEPGEVEFRAGMVKGNRALALHYVDARVVMDRLDGVLGVAGWQDEYECLPAGSVVCRLKCKVGEDWLVKVDVGSPSEQPDAGDRMKAAFSDALKRAAVKYGIGRYLYSLPSTWHDWDEQKKCFRSPPQLPASAQPVRNGEAKVLSPERLEAVVEAIRVWKPWLESTGANLALFNDGLKDLAQLKDDTKAAAWHLLRQHAAAHGWSFDKAKKQFAQKGAA